MRVTHLPVLLLAAVVVGCGASRSADARVAGRSSGDPAGLAATIDRAQAVIDDPSSSAPSLSRAARTQQLAFGELAGRRPLRRPTLGRLSRSARAAAEAALRAADALGHIVPRERRFPHWRIAAPPPAETLRSYFEAAGARYRLQWQYLAAIELVETRMGRIHGLSSAGARGPMQFMPATWAEYGGGSIESQRDAIMAAARFLATNGGRGSIARALFHYNPSQSYVAAVGAYAGEMRKDDRAFYGYYYWQVLYRTTRGTFLLPAGYPRARPQRLTG